jgi:hypothetical protein
MKTAKGANEVLRFDPSSDMVWKFHPTPVMKLLAVTLQMD